MNGSLLIFDKFRLIHTPTPSLSFHISWQHQRLFSSRFSHIDMSNSLREGRNTNDMNVCKERESVDSVIFDNLNVMLTFALTLFVRSWIVPIQLCKCSKTNRFTSELIETKSIHTRSLDCFNLFQYFIILIHVWKCDLTIFTMTEIHSNLTEEKETRV